VNPKLNNWLEGMRFRAGRASVVGIVVAASLVGAFGWIQFARLADEKAARRSFPQASGTLTLGGLAARVDVIRDARGVPHIEALSERDAFVAFGLVHAQDRLAQMLWLRRLAQGRTAEIAGKRGLLADRLARTLGFALHAEAELARLDPDTLDPLVAYSSGINSRLGRVRSGAVRAPESLAGPAAAIEDWRPVDSIAVQKLLAWSSSNGMETGLVLDDLIRWLGGGSARPFFPSGTRGWGVEIPGDPDDVSFGRRAPLPQGELPSPEAPLGGSLRMRGGTAVAISGRHTTSGAPILIADLRLPATAPSLVYEVHLRGGEMEVAGASVPGIPLVWVGRNLNVAWSASPANAVTVDLYDEVLRVERGLYQSGSVWTALEERREVIRVLGSTGKMHEVEWIVRSTRHGPLINELLRDPDELKSAEAGSLMAALEERGPLALAWTGMLPGQGISSLLAVMRSGDAEELIAALEHHHEPVMTVVYADDRGNVGMQLAGWLPQRRLATDVVPVPGRMWLYDWRAPIEYPALPAQRISSSQAGRSPAWVMAADGPLDDNLSSVEIEWLWRTGAHERALGERLNRLLADLREEGKKLDVNAAVALQSDLSGNGRRDVIDALLRLSSVGGGLRPEAREVAQMLGRWDGGSEAASRGAAAYHVLIEHLIEELFAPRFGAELLARYLALPHVRPAAVVEELILAADSAGRYGGWSDVGQVGEAVRHSLRRTWVSLSHRLGSSRKDWNWGQLHRHRVRPFNERLPRPARFGSQLYEAPVGGNEGVLGRPLFERSAGSFSTDAVASYRMVVDLSERDRMRSSLAPGQAEHPDHPHFADGLDRWLQGRPSLLPTSHQLLEDLLSEAGGGQRLLLEPVQ